jgi:alginate O-acetyltransferase complex protein AlgI
MLFTDPLFLFGFLPAVLMAWFALRSIPSRENAVLVLMIGASLLFCSYSQLQHVGLLIGSIVFNWLGGRAIVKAQSQLAFSFACVVVAANLLLLGIFKYAGFFTGHTYNIVLPLAISFFTFQQISYVCDAYKSGKDEPNFLRYAFVVSFFPHLIAGPIVRYREIRYQFPSLFRCRTTRWNVVAGLFLIITGLAKKLVIADSLAPLADSFYAMPANEIAAAGAGSAFIASFAFYLQIYFDFSGYTDIAIGLARLLNIRFPNNFNVPYTALSVSDFWRRWHVTLSRFLRDYLYIPLGGGKVGPWRHGFNLMVTMLLGGLWHGAAGNFVVWGGIHGAALVTLHLWSRWPNRPEMPRALSWGLTQLFVFLTWIVFRAPSLAAAEAVLCSLLTFDFGATPALGTMVNAFYASPALDAFVPAAAGLPGVLIFLACGFVLATKQINQRHLLWMRSSRLRAAGLLASLSCLVAMVIWVRTLQDGRVVPFIYFQF